MYANAQQQFFIYETNRQFIQANHRFQQSPLGIFKSLKRKTSFCIILSSARAWSGGASQSGAKADDRASASRVTPDLSVARVAAKNYEKIAGGNYGI